MKPSSVQLKRPADSSHALRDRAETILRARHESQPPLASALVEHELQVHQLELRMQNEALRELHVELSIARERYRDLFENAPVPYLVLQRDSTIATANTAAAALLRVSRHQLVGLKLSAFVEPAHCHRFVHLMRATLERDDVQCDELSLRLAIGIREVRLESIRSSVDPQEWRVALVDLTVSRDTERQLERSRRLEAIGTFTAGIAHDFAGVLAVVTGGTELAFEQAQTGGDPLPPLRRVKHAALQGTAMIRQLLRHAAGPPDEAPTSYAIDASVRKAVSSLREVLGPGVELVLDLEAPGAEVNLDLGGPDEILLNLSTNAAHAMPKGGRLSISTRVVDAHLRHDARAARQRYVLLRVEDDGVGMDGATQNRVFEPFFTTKPRGKGTGLGLAMVYGIVTRAGGHILLQSELDKGTSFDIYLPSLEQEAPAPPLRGRDR
jgi:PAS domain S-box-containing protein